MIARSMLGILLLSFASATVFAGTPGAVLPEPGVLELIGTTQHLNG